MQFINIVFEVDENNLPEGFNNIEDAIQEMLCLAIHEGDQEAMSWLEMSITDIVHPKHQDKLMCYACACNQ